MITSVVVLGYLFVAVYVAGYTFYNGVVLRPRVVAFSGTEHAILALTCVLVGMLWLVFVPSLLVWAGLLLRRALGGRSVGSWLVPSARTARART